MTGPFLTAEWRHLIMLSWRIDPQLLEPLVPDGTTLDVWQDQCYISLVGFLFLHTRVLGFPIPFHRDFEEVNLRFYVRRTVGDEVRRGVCFIQEIVPLAAIAMTARAVYNEPYRSVPMTHRIEPDVAADEPRYVEYDWRISGNWTRLCAPTMGPSAALVPGSQEEFIAEHYWGYTRQRDGGTIEYRVTHDPWRVRTIGAPVIDGNLAMTFTGKFADVMKRPPDSALVANGSPVTVYRPTRVLV